jgi:hypothetical protein
MLQNQHHGIRTEFLTADLSKMLNNRLSLLLDDNLDAVKEAAQKLQIALPDFNIDRYDGLSLYSFLLMGFAFV